MSQLEVRFGTALLAATILAASEARAQSFTVLHSFSGTSDGAQPLGSLTQALDGNFYGATAVGGTGNCQVIPAGCGTIFKMNASGVLTTVHAFNFTDGSGPNSSLIQAADGSFYGTTVITGSTKFLTQCQAA